MSFNLAKYIQLFKGKINICNNYYSFPRSIPYTLPLYPFFYLLGEKQKNGKYIYIETSSPRRKGETALLLVKLEGRAFCMRFWYHMYGDYGIGSLKIVRIVKKLTDDHKPDTKDFTVETMEWEISKSRGNKWLYKELDLEVDRSVRRHAIHWVHLNEIPVLIKQV